MMEVNETLTRKVADLAKLELTDAEVSTFTAQLRDVLKYVEKLDEVRVDGVEPMTHPLELAPAFREDRVVSSPVDAQGKPKILQSAPEVLEDGFKVPPVL